MGSPDSPTHLLITLEKAKSRDTTWFNTLLPCPPHSLVYSWLNTTAGFVRTHDSPTITRISLHLGDMWSHKHHRGRHNRKATSLSAGRGWPEDLHGLSRACQDCTRRLASTTTIAAATRKEIEGYLRMWIVDCGLVRLHAGALYSALIFVEGGLRLLQPGGRGFFR